VGSIGKFGGGGAPKNVFRKCRGRGGGGGKGRKINAIILKSKAVEADSRMRSNESDRKK
jgi:hypothetical protein